MRPARLLGLGLRALQRDARAGELRLLLAALVVAVAAVAAVGFYGDRTRQALTGSAAELLAADLAVAARAVLPGPWSDEARRLELATATTVAFPSVVLVGEQSALAEVKAASRGYPLRGRLEIADRPFAPGTPVAGGPEPGEAWLDARLMQLLGLEVGGEVEVGALRLRVSAVLIHEPDRGGGLFSLAPRLLMHVDDLPASKLIRPGSRVSYRLLVAGGGDAVERFARWVEPQLEGGAHLHRVDDARPELRAALDRAERFLGLAGVVSVLVAGVAIAMAARRYARRHWDAVAVMRCLGAAQRDVVAIYLIGMLVVGLCGSLVGTAVGFLAQYGLAALLGGLLGTPLPPASWAPALPALLVGAVTVAGFGLPPLLRLREVPPLRVLRRELMPARAAHWAGHLPALAAVAVLVFWQAGDTRLAVYVLAGAAGLMLALAGAAWGLVRALGLLRARVGVAWRFGFSNVARRGPASVVQMVALGVGIMILLLLTLVRNDLLAGWRESLPADAPNRFLINVQPGEVDALQGLLRARGLSGVEFHPMVRGRLVRRNGIDVGAEDYQDPRAQRLVEREFNLSWAARLAPDNRVTAGRWWRPEDAGQGRVSVEQGLAETLGLALGDRLVFRIAGQDLEAEVVGLRSVEWDSFRANFFVLFPPGVLEQRPSTWITSFYLPPERGELLTELVRAHPGVTVLDVDALMNKVRQVIERVGGAVQYVFGFTLLAGLMVLYAGIQATQDERIYESALLRALGARGGLLLRGLLAEFVCLGLLAGLLAGIAAVLLGMALADQVFGFSYRPSPLTLWVGPLLGALGVAAAGVWGARGALRAPPLRVLRG